MRCLVLKAVESKNKHVTQDDGHHEKLLHNVGGLGCPRLVDVQQRNLFPLLLITLKSSFCNTQLGYTFSLIQPTQYCSVTV